MQLPLADSPMPMMRASFWRARGDVILFIFLYAGMMAALLNPTLHGRDGLCNYAPLRSALFDGDLNYANDYALFDAQTAGAFAFHEIPVERATGRPGNRYGIGAALLWAPFVGAVRACDIVAGREASGLESRYAAAAGLGSAFWAAAALWLVFAFCRRLWGRAAAWTGATAALWLSPLPFYAFFHTSMSHAAAFFAAAGFLCAWDAARRRRQWRWWAASGVMAGLAALIRIQDGAVVLAVGALEALLASRAFVQGRREDARRRFAGMALAGLCAMIVFLPQMAVWRILYGSFFSGPAPYLRDYSEFNLLKPVHAFQVLFSSNHGLFFWHPLLAAGLLALLPVWRREQRAGQSFQGTGAQIGNPGPPGDWLTGKGRPVAMLWAAFLATWYLTACWQVWFAGASFGNRFYISILLVFAAGWAALAARAHSRRARIVLWVIVLAGAVWNAGLMAQYGTGMIPRQGNVSFATLAQNQFTRVPSLVAHKLSQALRRDPNLK